MALEKTQKKKCSQVHSHLKSIDTLKNMLQRWINRTLSALFLEWRNLEKKKFTLPKTSNEILKTAKVLYLYCLPFCVPKVTE